MKFLKYNFHKLIVASFILSVPNIQGDEAIKISTRETSYELFSKITGLSAEEITHCCSIVRPIVIRRSRQQTLTLRQAPRMNASINYDGDIFSNEDPQPLSINPRHLNNNDSDLNLNQRWPDAMSTNTLNDSSGDESLETRPSNGYILEPELEQFNRSARKLVQESFRVI